MDRQDSPYLTLVITLALLNFLLSLSIATYYLVGRDTIFSNNYLSSVYLVVIGFPNKTGVSTRVG